MLEKISYNQFVKLATPGARVVLHQEIPYDHITPSQAYQELNIEAASPAVLLEFSPQADEAYAFIGINPIATLTAHATDIEITLDGQRNRYQGDPFIYLRQLRQQLNCLGDHPLTQLAAGAIGYLSYDAVRYIEKLPDQHDKDPSIADIDIKFYGDSIIFDNQQRKALVCHVITVTSDLTKCYQAGMQTIAQLIKKLTVTFEDDLPASKNEIISEFSVDLSDAAHAVMINKAKKYLSDGDIFQVVLSRTFKKNYTGKKFDIYRALKKISPSPYHFYLQDNQHVIVGASPEKVVSVKNGVIETAPLAGTRPRGQGKSDEQLAAELIADPKEVAEHVMLVDLARNDVGAVATAGSVKVSAYLQPLYFSHVVHIASTVQGQLSRDHDVIDVLKATFPAGTLSGAPKIRAMEIIDELENSRRSIYGGAIIALDRAGNLNTCITIRTAHIKENEVSIRAGGGIVFDSDPLTEAHESRQKATSVMSAVYLAERGLLS